MRKDEDKVLVVVKGAPEFVLQMCSGVYGKDGRRNNLSPAERDRVLENEIIGKCCKSGLRCIVYACKEMDMQEFNYMREQNNDFQTEEDRSALEQDLTLVAAFGLEDPLRDGVE